MGKQWDDPDKIGKVGPGVGAEARDADYDRYGKGALPYGYSSSSMQRDIEKRNKFIFWMTNIFSEALRVLKPGGHALVWALPRTSHWTAMALEDAGFEIRDCVYHVFGSGFPKSLDIGKSIDKQRGAERTVIFEGTPVKRMIPGADQNKTGSWIKDNGREFIPNITAPTTPEAQQWDGWGTALKPAVECWWLCRKPLSEKTVAVNVLKWGTGGINIDGCRVRYQGEKDKESARYGTQADITGGNLKGDKGPWGIKGKNVLSSETGRFPSHLIHDGSEEVLAEFPDSKTKRIEKPSNCSTDGNTSFDSMRGNRPARGYDGSGSASRFFYCAKSSASERSCGCEGFTLKNKTPQEIINEINNVLAFDK